MKKLYIIPGWQEFSRYKIYQSLASLANEKGYTVVFYDIDWTRSLSSQIFPVQKQDVVFGFSLGAVFARLIAQNYECYKLILASMTPLRSFENEKDKRELADLLGSDFTEDITVRLQPNHRASSQVVLYGDREGEAGDVIVPKTGHRLNARYINAIGELL